MTRKPIRANLQGSLPDQELSPQARDSVGLKDLNFKVSPEFHRAFKMAAVENGMSMKELLEACFTAWIQRPKH